MEAVSAHRFSNPWRMRRLLLVGVLTLGTFPALAKEEFFIEQAALLGAYRDICHQPVSDDTILTAIGSAMIEGALNRATVIARATKRGAHIRNHILKGGTQGAFCQAIMYYLESGYPK